MVENEIPTSTLNSPIDNDNDDINNVDDDDELNSPEDENIENLAKLNHLKGSYNNLFRDKFDDELLDTNGMNSSSIAVTTLNQVPVTATDILENVYSNISPQFSLAQKRKSSTFLDKDTSDPNLHVYSNVDNTNINLPKMLSSPTTTTNTITTPVTATTNLIKNNLKEFSLNTNKNLNTNTNANLNLNDPILNGSSTLLSDDLDLDDPVMAAGSFCMNNNNNNNSSLNHSGTMPKILNKSKSSERVNHLDKTKDSDGSSARLSHSISLEMKNVLSQANNVPTVANSIVNGSTNNSFLSPSRRLLHDTTMIDTALDLDSLEDSSLGNNSQACLVNKTAIA